MCKAGDFLGGPDLIKKNHPPNISLNLEAFDNAF